MHFLAGPRARTRSVAQRPKGVALAALALIVSVSLAACGGNSNQGEGPSKEQTHELDGGKVLAETQEFISADPLAVEGPSTALIHESTMEAPEVLPTPELPVTVTDMQDTEVTVTDTSRILAIDMYGTTSRIVYRLGLGDNLVGRDTSTNFPQAEHLPLVTVGGHDLTAEAILALDPSVIITDTSLGPWDVILQMRESGIPVVVVDSQRNIHNVAPMVQQIADALGISQRGEELAAEVDSEISAKIAEIAKNAPSDEAKKLRMAFLYVRGDSGVYYMFGQGTGADTLITALGGIDVSAEIGWDGMRPISDEGLISAAPDVIFVMSKGLESAGGVDGLISTLPAVGQTPAGEKKRIIDMDDTQILSYGPATADVLDALAVAVYAPEANNK
ncbi:ABC transporter substrate-binding protein [Jonesiaceae bacterium BS-20]|uniref:ABC transporter substrate-binding protein n=1 Tax=Jonesiaceae bacterium BS-20 TaxID=3120821 RepID=A0AAU7DYF8_9MICO